jgi:S1-C subfamily serine protease
MATQITSMRRHEQRKTLLELGYFDLMDLTTLLIATGRPGGVNLRTVNVLLDKMVEWSLVIDNDLGETTQFVRYSWAKPAISFFSMLRILDNVLLGRTHVVNKYASSVPAIIVAKNGTEQIGTGFLVHNFYSGSPFNGDGHIVTAKHNVDPSDNISFRNFIGPQSVTFEPRANQWTLHPTRDIAAMPVVAKGAIVPIYPFGTPAVLSRTISLGYPTISSTDRAYLLAHNGEINAVVTSYLDQQKYLLISNDVSPGNSGGPVLDDAGLCVGMVVRALEGQYEDGLSKANAAIPANEIQAFITSL